jgi:hypothetical protein
MIIAALLLPPLVCLAVGMFDPSSGISLSLALLPLLTAEVSIGSEKSISVAKLIFLVIIAVWLLTREMKSLPRPPLLPHWLAYIFALLVSSLVNGLKFPLLWHFAESIVIFAVFIAVTEIIQNDRQRRKMLHLLATSGTIVIFLWLIQKGFMYWSNIEIPLVLRVGITQLTSMQNSSTLAQPNYFAAYCLLLSSIFFSLAVGKPRLKKLAAILAGIGVWIILFWLSSAGAALSLIVAFIIGGVLFNHKLLKILALSSLVALTLFIISNLFFQSSSPSFLILERNSFLVREYALKIGYRAWVDNPLFGAGPGTFEKEFLRSEQSYPGP